MKNIITILTLAIAISFIDGEFSSVDKSQTVNPILGDISYEIKFGQKPDQTTDNILRIKTHLEYVEQLLRNKDVSHLSNEFKARRNHLLDLLNNYWTNGIFPNNYEYLDRRKPCFIDQDGNICAVGYLIEQTTNRQVAENINNNHKCEELLAMNDKTVANWINTSGLTLEECAMIQPAYGPTLYQTYNHITPEYGISSSIICGVNLSLNTVNGIQIGKGTSSQTVPVIGLITGVGQVVFGSVMMPKEETTWDGTKYSNESQKALSMVNIGLGTTTMILSAWNLISNRQEQDKFTSWNLYSFPTITKSAGMGLSVTRRF